MSTSAVEIRAPFGGVVTVLVEPGQHVTSGELLAVLEAMKMEAPITAPRAGRILSVTPSSAPDGEGRVAGGDLLVVLD